MQIHRTVGQLSLNPSVEALLHAFLPHKYVDHTHADSLLILTNQKHGEELIREALGSHVAVLSYVASGLRLAKQVIEQYERDPDVEGIIVINHGIFTFGEDARTSYERMIECVNRGETFIQKGIRGRSLVTPRTDIASVRDVELSAARFAQTVRGVCAHRDSDGGLRRFYVETRSNPDLVKISLS